jgi:hypothetical protein
MSETETGSPVISDREIWACAQQVMRQHGENAPAHIAERIGALALAGDEAGVETWKRIADRVDQLFDYGAAGQRTRH